MNILLILIPVTLVFAGVFLAAFFWAVRSGQYEDTSTPSLRMLAEDGPGRTPPPQTDSRMSKNQG